MGPQGKVARSPLVWIGLRNQQSAMKELISKGTWQQWRKASGALEEALGVLVWWQYAEWSKAGLSKPHDTRRVSWSAEGRMEARLCFAMSRWIVDETLLGPSHRPQRPGVGPCLLVRWWQVAGRKPVPDAAYTLTLETGLTKDASQ